MSVINDDAFLTLCGSIGAIANGVSRFAWGFLYDMVPFKILISIVNSLLLVCAITFPFVVQYKACFMIYMIIIYFAYGGLYAIFPSITYKIFGTLNGAKIYSLMFFGFGLGSSIQFLVHYIMVNNFGAKGN
jgi:OFA family oxalate/formate antiporter-like MFS transporter